MSLAEARVCASCHEFPGGKNWKGCEECDLWLCDICWDLEAEEILDVFIALKRNAKYSMLSATKQHTGGNRHAKKLRRVNGKASCKRSAIVIK